MSHKVTDVNNPEEEEWTILDNSSNTIYHDDEGKYEDDPRAGTGSKYYKEKHAITFAQNYLKTETAKGMDEKNKTAMKVWASKGPNVAAAYMMHQAGGDYSRMRSMYG